jgi:hypothetical protein
LVISAMFKDARSAQGAIHELRDIGVPAQDVWVSSQNPDLPTTEAEPANEALPVVTDFEVPPDEPLGGSEQLGLTHHPETNAYEADLRGGPTLVRVRTDDLSHDHVERVLIAHGGENIR